MSDKEFEKICKKFGISTKDGKIIHPLFDDITEETKKQLEEHCKDKEPPLFDFLRECSKPLEDVAPKFEWAINEPTITIEDWLLIGINIDNQEIWFNIKTKKIFEGNLN